MGFLGRPVYYAAAAYTGVVGLTIAHHEPWADEAQAWLLARDAGLGELWTRLLHYEGTPGLWHTLLYFLIRAGLPYQGLNIFSGLLGVAGVWLLLRYCPLPLGIRLTLPFTFFLCYQYAVIARSYDLLPVLLFACALVYKNASHKLGLFTVLLLLLAGVSVHGLVLSVSIACATCLTLARKSNRKHLATAAALYIAGIVLLAASAWPAVEVTFVTRRNFSASHFLAVSAATFRDAFTGNWLLSILVVALSIPFLWRGRGLLTFLLASVLLCGVGSTVYVQVWHQGVLLLAWLFSIWIAAYHTKPTVSLVSALVVVIAFQCYWTLRSVSYDWAHAYSGSLQAARFLDDRHIPSQGLLAAGFSCTAIQPYFPTNAFSNWNTGKGDPAFWDWSVRNRVNDPTALFSARRPPYLIAGYKADADRAHWSSLASISGYEAIEHFDGNLFWRDRIFEPEAFDLYKQSSTSNGRQLSSSLNMADSATAIQLLSGFHGIENTWRWTERKFSVALETPANAAQSGATVTVHLYIPDTQIQKLGPMTLTGDLDGHLLPPQTFTKGGVFTYSRDVPKDAFQSRVVAITFAFDKAVPPSATELRELGAVVTSIVLQ